MSTTRPRNRPPLDGFAFTLRLAVPALAAALLLLGLTDLGAAAVWILHVLAFSAVALVLFGLDKSRAGRGRRVSEANLLGISIAGGALGGLLGMRIFRHKTRKALFRIVLPAALVLHAAVAVRLATAG